MRSFFLVAAVAALAAFQDPAPAPAPPAEAATCDAALIKPESYRLTVEAQALNLTKAHHRWWDNYDIGKRPAEVEDTDGAAVAIAERARELDDRNLLAHAQLARQYLVAGIDARRAHDAWRRTLDAGGAIVWTATLFDVDDRAYFVAAFDRQGLRIYRFGQLAGAIRTDFGVPAFPGPDREELWRALGGCLPDGLAPEATIPWRSIREIETGNFVLWFELDAPVSISSDRGKRKQLKRVMINLHTARGDFDFRYGYGGGRGGPMFMRRASARPAAYQERVRGTLIELFDPEGRITLPPQRRSGW
jgi:hypothetical protein